MQISTKLNGLARTDCGRGRGGALVRERLALLGTRVRHLAAAAAYLVSNGVAAAWGELRSRMDAARGAAGRRRRMRVVESLALGGRRQLLLVRCDELEYLVGTGPDSVETIVLRQPGGGPEAASAAGAAQATLPQAARKTRSAGAGLTRPGAMARDRSTPGPWLVSAPGAEALAKNRIRAGESGPGRGSWT